MIRPTSTAALYLSLVFFSGLIVGGLGVSLYNSRTARAAPPKRLSPSEMRREYVQEMRTRLNLRNEQVETLKQILESTHTRFQEVREKWHPEVRQIQEEQASRIRAILDEGQKAEYEKMRQERDKEREKRRPGPPRSGGRSSIEV